MARGGRKKAAPFLANLVLQEASQIQTESSRQTGAWPACARVSMSPPFAP